MSQPIPSTSNVEAEALASTSTSDSHLVEQLDDNSNHVRQKILALRQKKKAQLSASASLTVEDASSITNHPDRLTWFGVEDDASPSASRVACWAESRNSEEEDDADSTILGHYVSALPLPPKKSLVVEQTRSGNSKQSWPSFASEETCGSSHESSSQASCMLDDDTDAHSLQTTTATDNSSGPPSRRASSARASIASHRRSHNTTGKDLSATVAAATAPGSSKPIGPPPSMPLPPRPVTSPNSPCSPCARNGEFWPSRRSSRASALTAASSRSSTSARSSWKSSNPSIASSRLIPTPSERSDTSDLSDEELMGIRDISNHFPSPTAAPIVLPPSLSHVLEQSGSLASNKSRFTSESGRAGSQPRRSASASHRTLSPVQDSPMDLPFDTPHARNDHIDAFKGEESSDSALSDVLDLTNNKGILMVGKRIQPAALHSGIGGVARVGLGARTLTRFGSEQSLRQRAAEQLEVMQDSKYEHVSNSAMEPSTPQSHHKRSSTMTKSMSELVAALDLEASEWGRRLGESESMEFDTTRIGAAQARESHLLDARLPGTRISGEQPLDQSTPRKLPVSDSMPTLSPSGSQELSLDDSQGPATAESSLIRSNSVKSNPSSLRNSTDFSNDVSAGAEFRSIYDAYRASTSTMASRFTAPVVRIENPEGDELSDSELEGDVSSSDDMPRKRNKPSRKDRLGFEEQRAALRPRPSIVNRSTSLSARPSQTFKSTLVPTQEEDSTPSTGAPTMTSNQGADPYAFYEFSPSLPPFMPTGLSPRDLTGRGTWSSIVARASERMRSRQPSVASLASLATTATSTGPVSMRQIRATARAKQRQADAAHRAREEMSDQIAAMSYRPFAIHDHARSFANHAGMALDRRTSVSTVLNAGSPDGMASGRSSSMSSLGYADSIAPSVGDYGSRWPVAIGADQGVGPDDAASMFGMTSFALSRRPSASQYPEKKYVEFCMQTSPQPSPTESRFPISDSLTIDDAANRADAEVGSDDVRPSADLDPATPTRSNLDYLSIDAPMLRRRRKSAISLLSMHDLNAELDQPGLWPTKIRAPRLSSHERRRSNRESTVQAALDSDNNSDEESDLDVSADLEDLAERSGILDASRGFKRKLHSTAKLANEMDSSLDGSTTRPIASIPARSRRISAALDRIRAQRISRNVEWNSSDDEEGEVVNTPQRKTAASGRPSLPASVPAKVASSANPLRRSKSMASMGSLSKGAAALPSPSLLRARAPSPDLSVLTNPSDDEEVLLTADLELDTVELSHKTILDEEFDMMVGQTISSRFSNPVTSKTGSSASADPRRRRESGASGNSSGSASEDSSELSRESGKDLQQTLQMQTRSRTSSMSSVIEMIQEADELLSSTGHSIGHSSGHDTNISDTDGTSGHDPHQKPNQVLAEIIRRRLSIRLQGLQTPVTLTTSSRFVQSNGALVKADSAATENVEEKEEEQREEEDEEAQVEAGEEGVLSPNMQDTPDTMAGSEIWTSFHVDRSSFASTATTWSYRSNEDVQPRLLASKPITTGRNGVEAPADDNVAVDQRQRERDSSTSSLVVSHAAETSGARAIPVLRRKSSGLPIARSTNSKSHSRPSLPLPTKSDPLSPIHANVDHPSSSISVVSAPTKLAMRRYQSVATLRSRPSSGKEVIKSKLDVLPTSAAVAAAAKENFAGGGGGPTTSCRRTMRYSEGYQATTPSKAIRSVGSGITPSKLPSLRNAASTTSLRARAANAAAAAAAAAAADQTVDASASSLRKLSSGIPQRLPNGSNNGRSRLPSPGGTRVSASGLLQATPTST
ncbi:uncharacterized protein UTRI_05384 [Ustilago trichophora]|uniref:Uncharacterized protein n=1 Tax=Ustilago trichophora TaxID=86804 RepID=A0A5C3EM00_9BASI|nr:uncharacterized protein UTRI_05384 [Ustilago trichophora]